MLRNYFKTAIRNLLRYKGFSLINILSLSIGIIGCLAIGLFVWDELQYDKFIPGGENIYRIYEEHVKNDNITKGVSVPPAYATFLTQNYPEVESSIRILMSGDKYLFEVGDDNSYEEKGWFVENSFFEIFPLNFIAGDALTALENKSTIVISKELSEKYFRNDDPINKIIKIDKEDFIVKGVFEKYEKHFHLDFNYLMSLSSAELPQERMENWTWHQFYTYIKVKPGTEISHLQNKFQDHVRKEIHPTLTRVGSSFLPFFQPLKDIHLKSSDFIYDNAIRGNASYVKGLSIIALFVLLIACFNFINLSTARSFRRAKEIGVRKVIGADRKQLVFQFIGESILLSGFAVIVAITAMFFIVPFINDFTDKSISFNPFTNPLLFLLLIASAFIIGITAGIYPALVLSGFKPVLVLKGSKSSEGSVNTGWLRHALVVVQFALSALLIVSAVVVYKQTNFMNEKDLGFNKEQVIYFQVRGDVEQSIETFKEELKKSSNVISVTSGYGLPGDQYAGDGIQTYGSEGEKAHSANVFIGDHDYIKTLGLKVIAGRDFTREMMSDESEAFIINETAVKELGFGTPENAIGQPLGWNKWIPDSINPVKKGKIIGVVQDFHYKSLHEKVTTSVIHIYPPVLFKAAVKVNTSDIKNTIAFINETWNKFSPGFPLDYKFMDETFGAMYEGEQKLSTLLWIFTVMAVVVGCMGLFALAAFSAEQRTKEIGIRKVLGASVLNILGLLSKNFLLLVILASAIAFPIAWWAMNNWLQNFPYRVNISIWIFIVAGVAAVVITILTISFQTIRAATANPVKNLRTE